MRKYNQIKESEERNMGGLIIVLGLGWLIYQLIKDANIKPASKGTDYRQAFIDLNTGKCNAKEMDKRVSNGYYVKKDK